jgi:hypothetical protein
MCVSVGLCVIIRLATTDAAMSSNSRDISGGFTPPQQAGRHTQTQQRRDPTRQEGQVLNWQKSSTRGSRSSRSRGAGRREAMSASFFLDMMGGGVSRCQSQPSIRKQPADRSIRSRCSRRGRQAVRRPSSTPPPSCDSKPMPQSVQTLLLLCFAFTVAVRRRRSCCVPLLVGLRNRRRHTPSANTNRRERARHTSKSKPRHRSIDRSIDRSNQIERPCLARGGAKENERRLPLLLRWKLRAVPIFFPRSRSLIKTQKNTQSPHHTACTLLSLQPRQKKQKQTLTVDRSR